MEPHAERPEEPLEAEQYQSMTTEWDAYFASQKYESKDSAWRNAVLQLLTEMNILEEEHKSDPCKAVRAVADEGARRAIRRRSTD